jgi:glycosyltransferase involved in cell wall biosynthesis
MSDQPSPLSAEDLTVVIPTRERWSILERTLAALRRQTVSGFEVIVVVDGEDQSPPPLAADSVTVLPRGGPGAARNAGVRAATRTLVLFLGDDMIADSPLVERHLEVHRSHPMPEVAVLGHVAWHEEVQADRINRWLDWSRAQFDYRGFQDRPGETVGFGRFYSCNVSLKRELFLAAGGFDEDFVYYYEDLDCGWRLEQRGMQLIYEPGAVARHLHAYDWAAVVRRYQLGAAGERLMAAKHEWFEPFFLMRARQAADGPWPLPLWPLLVDRVPERWERLRRGAERRADRWYWRRLAPTYMDAWGRAEAALAARSDG